jgi:dsDNA-specific endonuclease/ATPase MutS2
MASLFSPPDPSSLRQAFGAAACWSMTSPDEPTEPVEIPITGDLDLHIFRPDEMSDLLPEYFHECQKRGLLSVRVAHGKGTGALRNGVHQLLARLPMVKSWTWPASAATGGWGATWVFLRAADGKPTVNSEA